MTSKSAERKQEDTAVFRRDAMSIYACDQDRIRHTYSTDTPDYLAHWQEEAAKLFDEGRYYDSNQVVDIYSRGSADEQALSNFYEISRGFEIDGVEIRSMEGFIQSLKTSDTELQKSICALVGKDAWQAGHSIEDFDGVHLYWNGVYYNRYFDEYIKLLERVYVKRYVHDRSFRYAINNSVGKKLIHTIGAADVRKTVLTADELIYLIDYVRKRHMREF